MVVKPLTTDRRPLVHGFALWWFDHFQYPDGIDDAHLNPRSFLVTRRLEFLHPFGGVGLGRVTMLLHEQAGAAIDVAHAHETGLPLFRDVSG